VALAEALLPGVPVSRAALAAYEEAKASAPDDDEGRMIEIVSRPK
jgi:3-hydroxyisobutyrate dehydrogenase